MVLNKRELFETTCDLWPDVVDLSVADAASAIYLANTRAVPADDKWRQVALWAFHQGLSELEEEAAADGLSTIAPPTLEYATFERWVRFKLASNDGWAEGRIEWDAAA